ncbi:hypothetical protein Csa_020552 [Cucumis sativus]|uniref:Uncharacterized protein n=1 Tax=Cucumis sativus TaxID=3659 RepID=A0A0A0K6N2_CUCSA|nr:hypothetical protein Csa_020552 [Cucumis sativus]
MLNIDASWLEDVGAGGVVRDLSRSLSSTGCMPVLSKWPITFLEAFGLIKRLQSLFSLFPSVILFLIVIV